MKRLTDLEAKLAQMFVVGVPGTEVEPETEAALRAYRPGGIIYFAKNYESPALLGEMSSTIQSILKEEGSLPPILSVDQEGGKVQRFGKPFTHFPEAAELGRSDSPKLAFEVAEVMAKELMAVGVNLNFWPLCDIHTRANNPVIGKRAFGTTEEIVSKMSSAIVRGFIKNGMLSSVKHFPGHGDTTVDSHKVLPKVTASWAELQERELKPFAKAIKAKVDVIMVAHILNPTIDDKYPATLSVETITNRLRKEMRFSRLVITDDMQMQAITDNFGADEATVLAINAGNDLLIYKELDKGIAAIEAARTALAKGEISEARVLESYERIMEAKKRVLSYSPRVDIETLGRVVGADAHKAVLQELRGRSES